jgi:hypothetical protein
MGRDGRMQPARRAVVAGLGASALAMWPAAPRAASRWAPDVTAPSERDAPAQRPAPAPASAARAILYEEDPNDPSGKRYAGEVRWRLETRPVADKPPETVVRADVAVHGLRLNVTFRRNQDRALPASHTVDLMFTLTNEFRHNGITNVPGLLMKPGENVRGAPLAGLSVKVTTLYFLIGLSAVDGERQRNVELLRERAWFDVPIVYADGRRAILAFEKGAEGERVFNQAFAVWGAARAAPASIDRK